MRGLAEQRIAELAVMTRQRQAMHAMLHSGKRTQRKRGKMLLARDERQRRQVSRVNQGRAEVDRGERNGERGDGERGSRGNEERAVRTQLQKLRFRGTVEIRGNGVLRMGVCVSICAPICVSEHDESEHGGIQTRHEIAENSVFPAGNHALVGQISVIRVVPELHQLRVPREFPERHAENLEIEPFRRSLHLFLTPPRKYALYSRL